MRYEKYPVIASDDYHMYLFFSEGPRGKITKGVIYSQIRGNLYNLAFGNWDERVQYLDDSSRSNNSDRDKILATVASTAVDFTGQFPQAQIFIEGSTTARTRLYQMGISNNLLEINENFKIQGFTNEKWHPFRQGTNYEAFLIQRK
jgi:hypothetical protein